MKILVTGSAGFIGFSLTKKLLAQEHDVVGIDNINDYYDPALKYARLRECGIAEKNVAWNREAQSTLYPNYRFVRMGLEDKPAMMALFAREKFDRVINLAAQAGVRYSITHPDVYVQSNVVGFLNVLEACRDCNVGHLIYASSSSVYGLNEQMPFSVTQCANHPVSLYAATKKSNELMAHVYSHLYRIPTTGLRFFTVYGPWGRPDMSYFLFADAILNNQPIKVFNHGEMERDFTYIDDIVNGIMRVTEQPASPAPGWDAVHPNPAISSAPYRVYNIGNNKPVRLLDFIREMEKNCGRKAVIELVGMQPGDVKATWADVDELMIRFDYRPHTPIQQGLRHFMKWYLGYKGLPSVIVDEEHAGVLRMSQY